MTPQPQHGLLATSRYVPRLRLERSEIYAQHRWMAPGLRALAKGQRAMANWDEDAVTMAVEACRHVLPAPGGQPVSTLTLASTSLPFAERINAGIVAAAAGLQTTTAVRDVTSSARAATTELLQALQQADAAVSATLIVAAERKTAKPASPQEMIQGDGAAVAVVGSGPAIATLVGAYSEYADFIDHFRETGQACDYGWEDRWTREEGYRKIAVHVLQTCLARHQLQASAIDHFVMPATLPKINDIMAKQLGIAATAVQAALSDTVGDVGCAQPLAMLDAALRRARPGALILLAAFGSGCDALLLRRTHVPCPGQEPGAGKRESSYLKYLAFHGQLALDWGMRAEMDNKTALTAAWRYHARLARFEAGQCRVCNTIQFPGSRVCVNPSCRAQDAQRPVSMADVPARVLSHTSDFLAYTPHPPLQFGHIDFDGGGRVLMEFTDADQEELQPGLPVRMVYRIKEYDAKRGFRRYFWKATPIRSTVG